MHKGWFAVGLVVLVLVPGVAASGSHSFERSVLFTLTQTHFASRTNHDSNCLAILDPARDVSGEVEASWEAATPMTERLEVVLYVVNTGETRRAAGTSPLTIIFDGLNLTQGDHPVTALFGVQMADNGIAFRQPVAFKLSFDYEAEHPVAWSLSNCLVG